MSRAYVPTESPNHSGDPGAAPSSFAQRFPIWALLIGGVVGLALGLFLAWIVWPVNWTNAWPSDLSPEARAQYLAAVSEAYIYYGDERAAEIARNRLFDLDDDLAAEIAAAQQFFEDNPQRNSRIYISNLGQLATGLGISSPDIIVDVTPVAGDEAAGSITQPSEPTATDSSSSMAWWNWVLAILAAFVLVIGAIMIIRRLGKRRQAAVDAEYDDSEVDEFEAEPAAPLPMTTSGGNANAARATAVGAGAAVAAADSEDYQFEEEPGDAAAFAAGAAIDEINDEEYAELLPPEMSAHPNDVGDAQPAAAPRAPVRTASGRTVATYTASFQEGIPDFEQKFSITDPQTGRYLGDCGIAVNMKSGVLPNNPESVIALDVFVFDKGMDRQSSYLTRVLMSEYASDNDMEQLFERERPGNPPPVVPQRNVKFQIKGHTLSLDCAVVDVAYTKGTPVRGAFQNLVMEMTARVRD